MLQELQEVNIQLQELNTLMLRNIATLEVISRDTLEIRWMLQDMNRPHIVDSTCYPLAIAGKK